ncbi:MAG: DUF554 domain-containing protein [Clostridium perfringens]|nr:DUF554 domain-containing protein [Clostridium perfringens]
MLGTAINTIVIILGSLLGLLIKGGIPERISKTIMQGLALAVLYIGISGAFKSDNMTIIIISMALGALIGEFIDIDKRLNNLGNFIELRTNKRFNENKKIEKKPQVSIAQGFVYSSLMFCVGAMAIVGALESGLQGNHSTLFAKSALDGISSIVLTASLGIGVIFSAVVVFIYQGIIVLAAGILSTILTESVIVLMTSVGSLLIIGLALNILDITKIKIANLLPAVVIPVILSIIGII